MYTDALVTLAFQGKRLIFYANKIAYSEQSGSIKILAF